ncbi:MAG TPA: DUF2637 domain-containing protein [Micromonosporaceae bacterium]|nr:DUF2637 domain-containing protein [Micromonosporaceae bacterium]
MPLPQLRRVRWAVRATLTLGVAASVVANILHAQDNPISQAIAAWPPLALLLTVELISRVPVHRRSLAVARLGATATIAGIAAWVSYWHMAGVAARYGETGASPYLLPLSVDGLIVVASICLVELGGRISVVESATSPAAQARADALAAASPRHAVPDQPMPVPAMVGMPATAPGAEPAAPATAATGAPAASRTAVRPTDAPAARLAAVLGAPRPSSNGGRQRPGASNSPERKAAGSTTAPAAGSRRAGTNGRKPAVKSNARPRRPVAETAALAAAIKADRPTVSEAELAQELGISTARLRAVRRQARELELAA